MIFNKLHMNLFYSFINTIIKKPSFLQLIILTVHPSLISSQQLQNIFKKPKQMSNDPYTVPTLSLTGSRSRKNIPTKDAYQPRTYLSETMIPQPVMTSGAYLQKKQTQAPGFFGQSNRVNITYNNLPPRPRANDLYPPQPPQINPPRPVVKQISRNVYLSIEQQSTQNTPIKQLNRNQPVVSTQNTAFERAKQALRQSGSRSSLMSGTQQSRVEIQNQVKRQTNNMQFKKIDINKALFDRKLAKIMQQIDFYDQQLNSLYTQSLTDRIQQLQTISKESKLAQRKIITELNSLIA